MALNKPEAFLTGIALIILSTTIVLSYKDWRRFQEATVQTRRTQQILEKTEALTSSLKDAETGQRGYLLTGDKRYLDFYSTALLLIPGQLNDLKSQIGSDARHGAQVASLEPLISEKLTELKQTIDVMDTRGPTAAIEIVRTDQGKRVMDRIRVLSAQIVSAEYTELTERFRIMEQQGVRSRLVTTIGSAVLFLMLLVAGVGISSAAARRERLIGELSASENRTAEMRDLLQTTLSSIGDAVITTDAHGKVNFLNPVAQALTGYTQSQALDRPIEEVFRIVNESSRAIVESPVSKVLREGTVVGLANHTVLIARNGVETQIDDSGAPIRGAEGSIEGVVLVFRDITERKKAEKVALRLAAIVESSDDAIIAQNLDGVVTSWNAGAETMFGYSASEMIGRELSAIVFENVPPDEASILECIRRGEQAVRFEAMRRRKDGAPITIAATVSPIRDEAGNIIGVSKIARDVTDRNKIEVALWESEERLRLSAEAAQIGYWSYDLDPVKVGISPQLEALLGIAPGSFTESSAQAAQLLHPEDRERVLEPFARAVQANTNYELEFRIVRPDGETRWMLAKGGPICASDGRVVKFAGVLIDITGRKRLEEKMRQSQKLESLGVLAGGIAHDFNNLLVGILGNASVLTDEVPPDSPLRDIVENLMQASERAAHLTHQMLAYSGKGRFTVVRLNLEVQVQQILALIDASIPRGVKIELSFQPDLPPIEADAGQIQQLIMNLVINGAEAIGPEGGTVTVSTTLREIDQSYVRDNLAGDHIPPGAYIVLEVHDTGIGMDTATQAKIFDPFFTTKFTGRGLGLAAVQGIVRGHKGALTIYSEPGKGSTFKVFLPAATSHEGTREDIAAVFSDFHGEGTILVVDDEELVQRTLRTALQRYGYTVLTVGSGQDAIRMLRETPERIGLVLLDMTMPVMSGEETLRGLLAIRRDLPVIATSGYNEMEALKRFGHGLSGFIQKPYTPRKLAEKIRAVLHNRKSSSQA